MMCALPSGDPTNRSGEALSLLGMRGGGHEHSIVNTFVIPAGMFFGAPITIADWWIWNQIPVTIGNIIAGLTFTGGMLFYAHYVPSPEKRS
jgi:formate/nitrite transporter FocA (FNT family)